MNKKLVIGLCLLLATWLFVGINEDSEFLERSVFLKYRPTFQIYFKSPLGMEDMPADYPLALRAEEAVYKDFVIKHHWSDNEFLDTLLTSVLILGSVYFMFTGLKGQFFKLK